MEDLVEYFGLKLDWIMSLIIEFGFRKDLSIEARLILIFMIYLGSRKSVMSFRRGDFSVLNVSEKLIRRALQELVAANLVSSAKNETPKKTSGRPIDMFTLNDVSLGANVKFSLVGENEKLVESLFEKGVARSASGVDIKIKVAIDYLILILVYAHPSSSGEIVFNDFARSVGVRSARLTRRVSGLISDELIGGENLNRDYSFRLPGENRELVVTGYTSLMPLVATFKTLTSYIDLIGQDKDLLDCYRASEDTVLRALVSRHFGPIACQDSIENLFKSCKRFGFRVSNTVKQLFIREVLGLRADIGTVDAESWREGLSKAKDKWCEIKAQALKDSSLVEMIVADLVVEFIDEIRSGFKGESTVRFSSILHGDNYPRFFIRRLGIDDVHVESVDDAADESKN
jgi:hypothetical protein